MRGLVTSLVALGCGFLYCAIHCAVASVQNVIYGLFSMALGVFAGVCWCMAYIYFIYEGGKKK